MGLFDKMMLLYICVCIGCAFWQPEIVIGGPKSFLSSIFQVDYNATTNEPYIKSAGFSNDTGKALGRLQEEGRSGNSDAGPVQIFLWVIDPIWNVIQFIILLVALLFAPILIMTSAAMVGLPTAVVFMVGLPIVFMGLIGFVMFVRGYG